MDILAVQKALASQGFDPGPRDGLWGRLTADAVRRFEAAKGLTEDGVLTPELEASILSQPGAESRGLVWLDEARRLQGTREVSGPKSNPVILDWASSLGIPYQGDDIPWCGLFVAHCVGSSLPGEALPTNPLGARNWERFGVHCTPSEGAVLVFWRESKASGKGHVAFYIGEDDQAFHVLGGNQSDAVNIARVAKSRLVDSRWPKTAQALRGKVIKMSSDGKKLSENEA